MLSAQAIQARRLGHLPEAAKLCRQILQANPNQPCAWHLGESLHTKRGTAAWPTIRYYPRPEQRVAFFNGIIRRLEALPGVESVSVFGPQFFPFGGPRARGSLFEIQGRSGAEARADAYVASPEYFRSVRIPLLKGRLFGEADNASAPPVAIIGQIVAKRDWGQADPISRLIRLDLSRTESPWVTVVGVVGDIRNPIAADPQPTVYRPWAQNPSSEGVLMIRTASDPMSLAPAIRTEVHATDPTAPEVRIASLEKSVADYVSPQRFTCSVFEVFAAIGSLLAAFGVYGVMSYWVGARIPAIGAGRIDPLVALRHE